MRKISFKVRAGFKAAFHAHCLEAIQMGYVKIKSDKSYLVDWEEDSLTIHLVEAIKDTGFLGLYQIAVNYQPPIYNHAMIYEGASALKAPRVDFKFSKFSGPNEVDYYAEAKNLSEGNWVKSAGATVDASYYRSRYIDTGIENYLSKRYPEGCLVGYIVNGNEAKIVSKLNRLISSRGYFPRIGQIVKDASIPLSICYCSENQSLTGEPVKLCHLFLQLA